MRRRLPIMVAQLHGLGEQASSSSTRPFFVRGPQPRRQIDCRSTSWEYWTDDAALIDVEGWHIAGYDTSCLFPLHDNRYSSEMWRATRHMPSREHGGYMENEMFWCCSGLATATGLRPNLNVNSDSEDDIMGLVQGEIRKKWLKQSDRRRAKKRDDSRRDERARRTSSGEASRPRIDHGNEEPAACETSPEALPAAGQSASCCSFRRLS